MLTVNMMYTIRSIRRLHCSCSLASVPVQNHEELDSHPRNASQLLALLSTSDNKPAVSKASMRLLLPCTSCSSVNASLAAASMAVISSILQYIKCYQSSQLACLLVMAGADGLMCHNMRHCSVILQCQQALQQ